MSLDLTGVRGVCFMNHCIIVCVNNVGEMAVCIHGNIDLLCLSQDESDKNGRVNAEIKRVMLICHHQMLGVCSDGGDAYPNSSVYVE